MENQDNDISRRKEITALAHRRTELAKERTMLAYVRTITNLLLFGVAFLGLMRMHFIFFYAGIGAIVLAFIMLIFTIRSYLKHEKELKSIGRVVRRHVPFFMRGSREEFEE